MLPDRAPARALRAPRPRAHRAGGSRNRRAPAPCRKGRALPALAPVLFLSRALKFLELTALEGVVHAGGLQLERELAARVGRKGEPHQPGLRAGLGRSLVE